MYYLIAGRWRQARASTSLPRAPKLDRSLILSALTRFNPLHPSTHDPIFSPKCPHHMLRLHVQ